MTSVQSNLYASLLGTIRDLLAHNPIAIEKILDIIYLQLQLLTTATFTLTGPPSAPTTYTTLAQGTEHISP